MHALISRLFAKRGIKDTQDLSDAERADFVRWQGILSEGEITVDKILIFCKGQRNLIERSWRDLSNEKLKNERSLLIHSVYGALIEAIEGPKAERLAMEKYLQGLLDQP